MALGAFAADAAAAAAAATEGLVQLGGVAAWDPEPVRGERRRHGEYPARSGGAPRPRAGGGVGGGCLLAGGLGCRGWRGGRGKGWDGVGGGAICEFFDGVETPGRQFCRKASPEVPWSGR